MLAGSLYLVAKNKGLGPPKSESLEEYPKSSFHNEPSPPEEEPYQLRMCRYLVHVATKTHDPRWIEAAEESLVNARYYLGDDLPILCELSEKLERAK